MLYSSPKVGSPIQIEDCNEDDNLNEAFLLETNKIDKAYADTMEANIMYQSNF